MAVTYRQFRIELYEEHLEEASFLYEQRLGLYRNPEITWLDIGEFEERLEAHIDALVVGEDLALDVCKRRAEEGDFGELYATVAVFCRQQRRDLCGAAIKGLSEDQPERIRAVTDALKHEMPAEWEEMLLNGITTRYPHLVPMVAVIVGYRRSRHAIQLMPWLARVSPAGLPDVLQALGRSGEAGLIPRLRPFLSHETAAVRGAAAVALLRLGDQQTRDHLLSAARDDAALALPLALGGGRSATAILMGWLETGRPERSVILALGLQGDLAAMRALYDQLANPDVADAAAAALNTITAANINETVFMPEEFSEDELFPEELEKFRQGQPPTRPGGEPFGENVTRLTQNPADWSTWMQENRSRFDGRYRYRAGRPFDRRALIDGLTSAYTPCTVRGHAIEEAAIRYGFADALETDMPVVRQRRVLAGMSQRAIDPSTPDHAGGWYFAGQLLP